MKKIILLLICILACGNVLLAREKEYELVAPVKAYYDAGNCQNGYTFKDRNFYGVVVLNLYREHTYSLDYEDICGNKHFKHSERLVLKDVNGFYYQVYRNSYGIDSEELFKYSNLNLRFNYTCQGFERKYYFVYQR